MSAAAQVRRPSWADNSATKAEEFGVGWTSQRFEAGDAEVFITRLDRVVFPAGTYQQGEPEINVVCADGMTVDEAAELASVLLNAVQAGRAS
jgi:hypothetical protein